MIRMIDKATHWGGGGGGGCSPRNLGQREQGDFHLHGIFCKNFSVNATVQFFHHINGTEKAFPFANSILITPRKPGHKKNMAIEGETFHFIYRLHEALEKVLREKLALFEEKHLPCIAINLN